MIDYEYKFFPAPLQVPGGADMTVDGASFAPTLQRQMNLISANGWEFVGREAMPVERRVWLVLRRTVYEDFLVFRRPLSLLVTAPKPKVARPAAEIDPNRVYPRRVARNYFPDARSPKPGTRRPGQATTGS